MMRVNIPLLFVLFIVCISYVSCVEDGEKDTRSVLRRLVDFAQENPTMHSSKSMNARTPQTRVVIEKYLSLDEHTRSLIDATLDQTLAKFREDIEPEKTKRTSSPVILMSEDFFNRLDDLPLPKKPILHKRNAKEKRTGSGADAPSGDALHTYPTDFIVSELVFPTDGKDFMSQPVIPYPISGLSGGAMHCSTSQWPTLQDSGRVLGLWKELQEIFLNVVQVCDFLPETYGARRICLGVVEFVSAFVTAVAEFRYRHMNLCRNILDYASTKSLLDNTIEVHKQVMLMRRLQIEDILMSGGLISSFAVPRSVGGQFEAACYVTNDALAMAKYYGFLTPEQEMATTRILSGVSSSSSYITNTQTLQQAYYTMTRPDREDDSDYPSPIVEANLVSGRNALKDKCFFSGTLPPLGDA
jgi:hypothetical protein